MQQRRLGRTELNVSIAGLGCGGPSRLGMRYGKTVDDAADLVKLAMDLGVTYFDTAEAYGTEEAVGQAIRGRRDAVVLSSKTGIGPRDGVPRSADDILRSLDASLTKLGTDHIDVYHMHGVSTQQLAHAERVALPALLDAKAAGKIRHLAVSEAFDSDRDHRMLQQLLDSEWVDEIDVVMVGFNLLNPGARETVLPLTMKHDIGTEVMFAVRRALSDPAKLSETIDKLIERKEIDAGSVDRDRPLDFLRTDAQTVTEAAYRFCAHEPGLNVILFGTGDPDHLRQNIESINRPALSDANLEKLEALFGKVTSVSGG